MGHDRIMINLSTKGDITAVYRTRPNVVRSEKTRDQRVPSQTTTILLTMEETDEDPVNPRGSRHCQLAGHAGLGGKHDPGGHPANGR